MSKWRLKINHECPYCGVQADYYFSLKFPMYDTHFVFTCPEDDGGCGKLFAATIRLDLSVKTYKMAELKKPAWMMRKPSTDENKLEGCRNCGAETDCVYCSDCATKIPCSHGNIGECDACDREGDFAYDSMREGR